MKSDYDKNCRLFPLLWECKSLHCNQNKIINVQTLNIASYQPVGIVYSQ